MLQGSSVTPPGTAGERSGPASHNGLQMGFTLSIAYSIRRKLGGLDFLWVKRVVIPTSSD